MNILLTSSGRRTYLVKYFQRALGSSELAYAANSEWSAALQVAKKSVITPKIYNRNYIKFLLDYCKKNQIKAIIPLFDIDLPVLAKAREKFKKNNIEVIVSDIKATQICNDKWHAYNFFKKNDISTPKTFLSIKDVKDELLANKISYPLIIKPRWGMGSIGIHVANNKDELELFYKKTETEIKNSYLKYESKQDISRCVVFQEKIKGQEYGLDVVNDLNKNYITTFVKRKLSMRAGETDRAITEQNSILSNLGEELSNCLKHVGNVDVDCFLVKNQPYILEMNCRFGGGYPFSHIAGAKLPKAIIYWLKGEEPPSNCFNIKYNIEAIKDINMLVLNKDN